MGQFIVRNLEDDVKARLKRRAAHHKRSMEEEVRHILRDAVKTAKSARSQTGLTHCSTFCESGPHYGPSGIARSGSAVGGIR